MSTSRLYWAALASGATGTSIGVPDQALRDSKYSWHVFTSGTLNGASLQVEYSPDTPDVTDGNSRWFSPSALAFSSALGDVYITALPRKWRPVVTGGGGSTSITVEVR